MRSGETIMKKKETKGGMIKVREFRGREILIKYVPKSKLIEL